MNFAMIRKAVFVISLLACTTSAVAGTIRIEAQPSGNITLQTQSASPETILRHLADKFGFQIQNPGNQQGMSPITATYRGGLQAILRRLLRNRNHIIIRSATNKWGIHRVVILDKTAGTATRPLDPHRALKVKQRSLAPTPIDLSKIRNLTSLNARYNRLPKQN